MFLAAVVVHSSTMPSVYWPKTRLRAESEAKQATDNHHTECEVSIFLVLKG